MMHAALGFADCAHAIMVFVHRCLSCLIAVGIQVWKASGSSFEGAFRRGGSVWGARRISGKDAVTCSSLHLSVLHVTLQSMHSMHLEHS